MKFLIYNYATHWSTQSLYFHTCLNSLQNSKSSLFDINKSIYDNFDLEKPDIFITHYSMINQDLISYLEKQRIKLAININNIEDSLVDRGAAVLKNLNIDYILFGCQDRTQESYHKILPAADIFLSNKNKMFDIDKLIFVSKKEDICELSGTYHYTSIHDEMKDFVDFSMNIIEINQILPSYKKIVFKDPACIGSQICFDSIYNADKVVFEVNDNDSLEKIDRIFKKEKLLSSVKNKHTCLHRVKTLLKALNLEELSKEVNQIIEQNIS